jgi:hypothetical protein
VARRGNKLVEILNHRDQFPFSRDPKSEEISFPFLLHLRLYSLVAGSYERQAITQSFPPSSLPLSSLQKRGKTSPEKTDRGYDLRSRRPPSLDSKALDTLVSRSRRSETSSSSATSAATSHPAALNTANPHSSPTSTAPQPSAMTEPTIADLAKLIEGLTGKINTLQTDIDTMKKDKTSSSGAQVSSGGFDGQHHTDRPPRFQKLDFPRYDGKSDPLVFINRYESYFHQQRIMEELKVWMASYNLEDKAQLWYMQVQQDKGIMTWRRFKDLLNLRYGPPLRSAPLFELAECRRTGTVEEYQDRFQALLPHAGPLGEAQRVQLFTRGCSLRSATKSASTTPKP